MNYIVLTFDFLLAALAFYIDVSRDYHKRLPRQLDNFWHVHGVGGDPNWEGLDCSNTHQEF